VSRSRPGPPVSPRQTEILTSRRPGPNSLVIIGTPEPAARRAADASAFVGRVLPDEAGYVIRKFHTLCIQIPRRIDGLIAKSFLSRRLFMPPAEKVYGIMKPSLPYTPIGYKNSPGQRADDHNNCLGRPTGPRRRIRCGVEMPCPRRLGYDRRAKGSSSVAGTPTISAPRSGRPALGKLAARAAGSGARGAVRVS